jgi:hypothetical protein
MTLPTTLLDWLSLAATILTIVTVIAGFGAWLYRQIFLNAFKNVRRDYLVKRYEKIYAPMAGLFLTRHVTSTRAILAYHWRQRWMNANKLLKKGQIYPAFIALFDKRITKEAAEFEYGHVFPLNEILEILKGNEAYADKKLLQLIRRADIAQYENQEENGEPFTSDLTDEEFDLFRYIVSMNDKLKLLFCPK